MNTLRTDHGPMEIDNREQYRQRLIASRLASQQRRYITDIRWWDEPISWPLVIGLTLFAAVAIIGIAKVLPAILEGVK